VKTLREKLDMLDADRRARIEAEADRLHTIDDAVEIINDKETI